MSGLLLATCPFVLPAMVALLLSDSSSDDDDMIPWWDKWNFYEIISEEYTDIIDSLLIKSKYAMLNPKILISQKKKIPGLGIHYYYKKPIKKLRFYDKYNYFGFMKMKKEIKSEEIYYYVILKPSSWLHDK